MKHCALALTTTIMFVCGCSVTGAAARPVRPIVRSLVHVRAGTPVQTGEAADAEVGLVPAEGEYCSVFEHGAITEPQGEIVKVLFSEPAVQQRCFEEPGVKVDGNIKKVVIVPGLTISLVSSVRFVLPPLCTYGLPHRIRFSPVEYTQSPYESVTAALVTSASFGNCPATHEATVHLNIMSSATKEFYSES